uniref:Uncharacterized protein n=1 Tax=Arundo donax TaxID=35708 RepID=A0A0A8Z0S3_ARUDO
MLVFGIDEPCLVTSCPSCHSISGASLCLVVPCYLIYTTSDF